MTAADSLPNPPLAGPAHAAALLALVEQLARARSIAAVTAAVRSVARRLIRADGITVILRDGEHCHYVDEDAIAPLWKGRRFPMDACVSGWVMRHGTPAVIPDVYADPRVPHDAYRPTFVRSMAVVPVRRDEPVAAIGAYWARPRTPAADELLVLEALADAAAMAIINVGLYEQLRLGAAQAQAQAAEAERQAEALARANAELERAHRAKDRFLSAASHDLRQPFQALRLFHGVLSQSPRPQDAPVLEKMGEAMAQGEELLHALLDVSTLQVGMITPAPQPVPLAELFARIEAAHAPVAATKGLRLRLAPSSLAVFSDPLLLSRMLGNLVANAIRFTEQGAVLVAARRRGAAVRIEVRDSGPGIPPERWDEVFEDFVQLGNPERDRRNGLGLGLGIVRRLGRLLDHPVTLCSYPGRGSVFGVIVPAS